jgi:hypothetical protein
MSKLKSLAKRALSQRILNVLRMLRIGHLEGKQWHILHWGAPATYCQDGLLSVHATGYDSDQRFLAAYEKGRSTGSWGESQVHWRAYVACWAGLHALKLGAGDFVEAGSNRGGTALTMVDYLGSKAFSGRRFYLMDTFSGMDFSLLTAGELQKFRMTGQPYKECYEEVKSTFSPYPFVTLIRGAIPGTLSQVNPERVVFLHIDMNSAKPEVAAMEYFWDRLVPGAVVLFDDYGWMESREQKAALDEFASSRSTKILAMPTGQGLLLKT